MSYTVLARRYRSKDFDEVIGQETIARTLKRAIETDRVAHAFLFTGTRGVGKTSMARIFAKALNVTPDLIDADAIADAVMRGDDIDVLEIDGASNRKVEEARELIANCIYRPARCPYKIYIIDEVHMLTREAFNTLLKTMEEPPEHVKFILCTTEPHKVPQTIQSRCQRFDFRTIPTNKVAKHLEAVLKNEGVETDEQVVFQVARLGNGSMRDALSLLDRLISDGHKKITTETLAEALGLPDHTIINALVQAIADADAAQALRSADDLLSKGGSIDQLLETLIERFRTLMHVSICGPDSELIDLTEDERAEAAQHAKAFDPPAMVFMMALLENVQRSCKSSNTARALVDATIVRLALSERFNQAAQVLQGASSPSSATTRTRPTQKKSPERHAAVPPLTATLPADPPKQTTTVSSPTPSPSPSPSSPVTASSEDPTDDIMTALKSDQSVAPFASDLAWAWPQTGPKFRMTLANSAMAAYARSRITTIQSAVSNVLQRPVAIDLTVAQPDRSTPPVSPAAASATDLDAAARIPIVQKAMDLLDARIVSITDDPSQPSPSKTNTE